MLYCLTVTSQACPSTNSLYQCPIRSSLAFTYYSDVTVNALLPSSGKSSGDTRMTVFGSGFRPDLTSKTRCVFTRCTIDEIYTVGDSQGCFRDPTQRRCTGSTTLSNVDAVTSTSQLVCVSKSSSTETYFAQFDVSLNEGNTIQGNYGPLYQSYCPAMYVFYATPKLDSVRPSLGPAEGRTRVTIIGVGFIGNANSNIRCKFGQVESTAITTGIVKPVQYISETAILCISPPNFISSVRVQISLNGADTDFTQESLGALFYYHPIAALSGKPVPSSGPVLGGTRITLTGSNFTSGSLFCKFWSNQSTIDLRTAGTLISSTRASCTTPSVSQSQLVSISISLNAQDFSPFFLYMSFLFFPQPVIFQLSPSAGPAQSGGLTLVRAKDLRASSTFRCQITTVQTVGTVLNSSFAICPIPQIQPKEYSTVYKQYFPPEVLPGTFRQYAIDSYPLEVSIDGQVFTSNKILYTYYATPVVDSVVPR